MVAATFNKAIWDPQMLDAFCDDYHLRFLPPVFTETRFAYMFAEKTQMPFWSAGVRKDGPFSTVEKWRIHRDHLPPGMVSWVARSLRAYLKSEI